jgi:hypothetical protein
MIADNKAAAVPLFRHTLRFLVPSFLHKHEPLPVVRPTDFLDGMRGFACVAVFISHCVPPFFPNGRIGFWSNNGAKNDNHIAQLPILRLAYAGTSMVLIFFVLSGFSITLKPLKLARQGASDLLYNNLVSATFRRTGRLYLPCVALMLLVLVQNFLGCFRYANIMSEKWPFLQDQVPAGLRLETGQFWRFCHALWTWADPVCISTAWKKYRTLITMYAVEPENTTCLDALRHPIMDHPSGTKMLVYHLDDRLWPFKNTVYHPHGDYDFTVSIPIFTNSSSRTTLHRWRHPG